MTTITGCVVSFTQKALEESLFITTGRSDLAIATHARKKCIEKYQYDRQLEYFS